MIPLPHISGKKIGVFGLAKSGEATVKALLESGAEVFAWDDKETSLSTQSSLHIEHFKDWPWPQLSSLILSPGVPLTHPEPHPVVTLARGHNVEIIGDIELLYRACPDATYIGITGTNGKSTTTALIGHILKCAGRSTEVGGNLGTPALTFQPLGKGGIYVLECSSYQLDLLNSARFNIACLLNITPDHLDRHGDMMGYINAKLHIFDRQQKKDVAVIAVDDPQTESVAHTLLKPSPSRGEGWVGVTIHGSKLIPVSTLGKVKDGYYVKDATLYDSGNSLMNLREQAPRLPGRHNWQNIAVAWAACKAAGLTDAEISSGIKTFPGLAHRMEWIADVGGVRFINDSKATNADATQHALAAYENNIYWILGGKPKEGGIEPLAPYFPRIRHAFLLGQAEAQFAKTLEGHVPYTKCGDLAHAFEAAVAMTKQHSSSCGLTAGTKGSATKMDPAVKPQDDDLKVILLSPACASWDQWKSFEHRGDAFREMVSKLTLKIRHPAA